MKNVLNQSISLQLHTSKLGLSKDDVEEFNDKGYLGPFDLFDQDTAKHLFKRCFRYPRLMLSWKKGRHVVVKELAEIATNPHLVKKIESILGDNLLLWGSILIRQSGFGKHPMHVDVEHSKWDGLSVWIAMQNVVSGSSFSVISGSHLFDTSPQELHDKMGLDCSNDEAVFKVAQKINPESKLVSLDVKDGQFIIFSGKIWHGTKNITKDTRGSIVLQYTTPHYKVRIPKTYSMPINNWYKRDPICLLVQGEDQYKINKTINIDRVNFRFNIMKALFSYFPSNLLESIKTKLK